MAKATLYMYIGEDQETGEELYRLPVTLYDCYGEDVKGYNSSGAQISSDENFVLVVQDLTGYGDWWGINLMDDRPKDRIDYMGHELTVVENREARDPLNNDEIDHLEIRCRR